LGIAFLVFWGIASLSAAEVGSMGPATFPMVLAVSLSILVILYWIQSRGEAAAPLFEKGKGPDALRALALVFLAFGAAYLWESLGAPVILLMLSLVELKWIEGFGWKRALAVGVVLPVGTWLVFTALLGVPLPLGLLRWLY